jgi:hypothetical protein
MTREEAKKIIGEGATDEQINALLNTFHAEQKDLANQITDLKGQVSSLTTEKTELLGYKTKLAEIEKSKLSEQEKLALAEKELAEAKKATIMERNAIKAKSILVGAGIGDAEADELVASIVKEDTDATVNSANLFVTQFNSIKENTAKQTKEELLKLNLKPNPTNIPPNSDVMTWEKFSQMNPKEQSKFAEEHPEEFAKL